MAGAAPAAGAWSEADRDGISTCWLSDPLRASLRGRRLRKRVPPEAPEAGTWPAGWKSIAAKWLKDAEAERPMRIDTLLRRAGAAHANEALRLKQHLFALGALCVEERRSAHGWSEVRCWFLDPAGLRRALGLQEPASPALEWQALRQRELRDEDLRAAAAALDPLPPRTAIARFGLLEALQRWRRAGRAGSGSTRRDFSYFARGDTKAIGSSEWTWLESTVDLAREGICEHLPSLLLAGRMSLVAAAGRIDCAALGCFVGVPATALHLLQAVENGPQRWLLVENRSAFDHLARDLPEACGAIWLPGYPPLWWTEAVTRLLDVAPAEAAIACDPDPDGVQIALQTGELWRSRGLSWAPWRMAPEHLAALPHHRDLGERDAALIEQLLANELPATLRDLLVWMRQHGRKGEQEALFDPLGW